MNTRLLGSLWLFLMTVSVSVIMGCDSDETSFVVHEADASLIGERSLGAQAAFENGDALAADDDEVIVIKDNGLSPEDGGTLPPSISGSTAGGGDGSTDGTSTGTTTSGGMPGNSGGGTTIEEQLTVASLAGAYSAGDLKQGSTVFSIDDLLQESRYVMSAEIMNATESFTQVNRTTMTETFKQGNDGQAATDTFMQNQYTGVLDVLVVIDNSGSMSQEQANLSTKLSPLLSEVANSDWQIGVVTTDNGCLRDLIKKGDANAETDFAAAVNAGISGSGNEQGIRYAVEGLSDGCQQGGWLRANSTVAVLIVSDEDNCSTNGAGCGSEPWNSEQYLRDHLATMRVPGVNARVYGIFWHPSKTSAECSTGAYQATQYAKIVADTNGTWGSICDADYTSTLSQISKDISVILQTQFALTHTPAPNTLEVLVNGQAMTTGYTLSGNVVTFDAAPAEGASIQFKYRYDYSPIKKEFILAAAAVDYQMTAQINGVATTAFAFDKGSNSVTFDDYPAQNADIKITFKKDEPLKKDFIITGEALDGTVTVKVNGQALVSSEYSFNAAAKTLSLAMAPYDGSGIAVSYKGIGAVTLEYPYSWGESQQSMEVYDLDTKAPIAATYSGGMVHINPSDFAYLRRFAIKDPNATGVTDYSVTLPMAPLVDSVKATYQAGECRPPDLKISGLTVTLEECDFGNSVNEGSIGYTYVNAVKNTYELEASFFEQEHKAQIWRVWVDGQLITNYDVNGNTVTINEELTYQSKVEIKVSLLKAI